MKVLYSQLKSFIPGLKTSPKAVVDALALTGLLVDQFDEIVIAGKKDYVIGLEVRQNRPDCLGVVGVAREVAAYLGLPFVLPKIKLPASKRKLQVQVRAHNDVKRASVLEVDGLDNSLASPLWLVETLDAYGMNAVSMLVDISNYAMIMTGYPNHIFDAGKVVGGLVWHRTSQDDTFTTLDGTVLELTKGKELVISDNLGPLVLASAVGGRRSAISTRTTSVLAEVAVYDSVKVRTDARALKVATEASNRLEKELSPELAVWALEFLANCLVQIGGGKIASVLFDHYPKQNRVASGKIQMNVDLPTNIAGIEIGVLESERILKRLGFTVQRSGSKLTVNPPSWRLDVEDAQDVAEEIIRIKGFNNIKPAPPSLPVVLDTTPPTIKLARRMREILPLLSLDEVLSLPMVTSEDNKSMEWDELLEVRTSNAVNEELPALRRSLAVGLINQQHNYLKKGLHHVGLFEIGVVFGKNGKRYVENERMGMLVQSSSVGGAVSTMQTLVETVVRTVGAVRLGYEPLGSVPPLANPHAAWVILLAGKSIGVLYQVKDLPLSGNRVVGHTAYAELDFDSLLEQLSHERARGPEELIGKLVVLDANVELHGPLELQSKVTQVTRQVGKGRVWAVEVVDSFSLPSGFVRYTLRVSYQNMEDSEAKSVHEKLFSAL